MRTLKSLTRRRIAFTFLIALAGGIGLTILDIRHQILPVSGIFYLTVDMLLAIVIWAVIVAGYAVFASFWNRLNRTNRP